MTLKFRSGDETLPLKLSVLTVLTSICRYMKVNHGRWNMSCNERKFGDTRGWKMRCSRRERSAIRLVEVYAVQYDSVENARMELLQEFNGRPWEQVRHLETIFRCLWSILWQDLNIKVTVTDRVPFSSRTCEPSSQEISYLAGNFTQKYFSMQKVKKSNSFYFPFMKH